jgi:dTDP-4-amino-4,6-dideoxygalactose transaminase
MESPSESGSWLRRESVRPKKEQSQGISEESVSYKVPFVDPRLHYRRYQAEIDGAISECLTRGDLINREQLRRFEANLAKFVGTKYAVGLGSGYHALALSLIAGGVGADDEVITVAHTFVATVSAIVHAGATPVLVDAGADYNMDIDAFERAITPKTKAVLPVHLNGRICDMERLSAIARKHGLFIVEDACQALGAAQNGVKAGSFGVGCWSFYPFKMLGGYGDGGAITTDDPEIARLVTLLRYNGEDRETGEFVQHGYTAILDNVQAAILDKKLVHLPEWIEHRRHIADLYRKELAGVGDLRLPHFAGAGFHDVFQNYVVRTSRRDPLRAWLRERGVETLVSWPKPMWKHAGLKLGEPHLPESEAICREVISLPMSAETTSEHVAITAEAISAFFRSE